MALRDTISGNETELYAALQTDPKLVPTNAKWFEKEPNSYDAFGEEQTKTARMPINSGRMKKKPVLIGSTANTGFNQDLTAENSIMEMEAFLFAARRDKGDVITTTIVADGYTVPNSGDKFFAGDMIIVEGEGVNPVNLGLKVLTANGTNAKILFATTADVGAKVRIRKCGHEFDTGEAAITLDNEYPKLDLDGYDTATLGLIPGEIVYLNGDAPSNTFANDANTGWLRVLRIDEDGIVFDKSDTDFAADNGAGKKIRLFFGTVVKNEKNPADQKIFPWAMRRHLSRPDTNSATVQADMTLGNIASELVVNVPEQEKITFDVTYMARKYKTYADESEIDPGGSLVRVTEADAISSAKDSRRLRIGAYPKFGDVITSNAKLLFPAFQELTITINNNVSVNNAITYEGAYAHTPGFFEVMIETTAYFTDVAGLNATSENLDLTFDFAAVKDNKGVAFDIPMLGVSTDGLNVELNEAITLDLEGEAGEGVKYNSAFTHAFLAVFFPYLPDAAAD